MTTVPTVPADDEIDDDGHDLPRPMLVPSLAVDDAALTAELAGPGPARFTPRLVAAVTATALLEPRDEYVDRAAARAWSERRPWAPWRVRLTFVVALVAVGIPLSFLMSWLWATSAPSHGPVSDLVSAFSLIWILLAVPVLLNVVGALTFRNASPTGPVSPITNPVCFRIVTRGTNVSAVVKTVRAVQAQMQRTPLFPYCIEVVTDTELPLPTDRGLRTIVVPADYRPPSGARFKARALHYALQVSPLDDTVWLFHLDEETHIQASVVRGIRNAIVEEEASGELRIGQGVVLYHRDLKEHPFLTLADSVRTGDDLGRFRLQHLVGQTAFGMHGSFILVRNDVEKDVGFDLGPSGSVTEDAWWSLAEMAKGHRSRWVDGYCLEQSTQSCTDFIKQRRRWFVGLCLVCLLAPARLWHRLALVSSVTLWGVGWLGWWSVSIAVILTNVRIPLVVFVVGAVSLAAYSALYLLGLDLNLHQRGLPWYRRIPWYVAQILLLPFFSMLEGSAVMYGLIRPDINFHVVKK